MSNKSFKIKDIFADYWDAFLFVIFLVSTISSGLFLFDINSLDEVFFN